MVFSVIFITGGASGLGEATSRLFSEKGYKVAIADIDVERGQQLAKELKNTIFVEMDVTDESSIESALDKTIEAFGAVHIILNSAGVLHFKTVISKKMGNIETAEIEQVLKINVIGLFNVCKYAMIRMKEQEPLGEYKQRGVIINVASLAGIEAPKGQALYGASKGAVIGMTVPMAREFGKFGVRVVAVAPGVIITPMSTMLPEKARKYYGSQSSMGRFMEAEEFADAILGISKSKYLTGTVIRFGGGYRIGLIQSNFYLI